MGFSETCYDETNQQNPEFTGGNNRGHGKEITEISNVIHVEAIAGSKGVD